MTTLAAMEAPLLESPAYWRPAPVENPEDLSEVCDRLQAEVDAGWQQNCRLKAEIRRLKALLQNDPPTK